jgi:hypothetical protein
VNSNVSSTFTFNESQKTASTVELMKTKPIEANLLRIKIHSDRMPNTHESIICFKQGSSDRYDSHEGDVKFRQSKETKTPSICPLSSDNQKLTIATYPFDNSTQDVKLVATVGIAGDYMLDIKNINLLTAYNCVELQDMENGHIYPISGDYTYHFTQKRINEDHTFILHFSKTTGICGSTPPLNYNVNVTASELGVSALFYFDAPSQATISVSNLLGQEILNKTIWVASGAVPLEVPKSNNLYLIKITTNEGSVIKKIVY